MFEVILKFTDDLSNYTLILPAISVGNVGQLAVDLIINSLNTTKYGYIFTSHLYPLVGNEAFSGGSDPSKGNLTTACEIYRCDSKRLIIVQIYSSIVRSHGADFRRELRKWIKEKHFEKVVLLSSSYAQHRTDAEIKDPTCRFLCWSTSQEEVLVKELNWKVLESNNSIPLRIRNLVPGGGITSRFYSECVEDDIPLVVLLKFTFEGNNIPDATELVSYLNQWLQLDKDTNDQNQQFVWRHPASWNLMFGNMAPTVLY